MNSMCGMKGRVEGGGRKMCANEGLQAGSWGVLLEF